MHSIHLNQHVLRYCLQYDCGLDLGITGLIYRPDFLDAREVASMHQFSDVKMRFDVIYLLHL